MMKRFLGILTIVLLTLRPAYAQGEGDFASVTILGDRCNINGTHFDVQIQNLGSDEITITKYEICKMFYHLYDDYKVETEFSEPMVAHNVNLKIPPAQSIDKPIDLEIFSVRSYSNKWYHYFRIYYHASNGIEKTAGNFFMTSPMYVCEIDGKESVMVEEPYNFCCSAEEYGHMARHSDSLSIDYAARMWKVMLRHTGNDIWHPDTIWNKLKGSFKMQGKAQKDLFLEYLNKYQSTHDEKN